MATGGYEAPTNPAPELGEDAMFVDVGAESTETPSREAMIEPAVRVRELLEAAN